VGNGRGRSNVISLSRVFTLDFQLHFVCKVMKEAPRQTLHTDSEMNNSFLYTDSEMNADSECGYTRSKPPFTVSVYRYMVMKMLFIGRFTGKTRRWNNSHLHLAAYVLCFTLTGQP